MPFITAISIHVKYFTVLDSRPCQSLNKSQRIGWILVICAPKWTMCCDRLVYK